MIIKLKNDKSKVGKLIKFVNKHNLVIQITTIINDVGELTEAKILDYHFNNGTSVLATGDSEHEALDNLALSLKEHTYISIKKELKVML